MSRSDTAKRKAVQRQAVRDRRQAMEVSERSLLDHRLRQILESRLPSIQPQCVAAFLAFDGEPDLLPTLQALDARGIIVALPVLSGRSMQMRQWHGDSPMLSNAFGIDEPVDTPVIGLSRIDLLLMPLVAYDRSGNRLGMGGGYYDRLLQGHEDRRSPLRVGVAYSAQEEDDVPHDPWDIRLHALVNEQHWISFPE